MVSFCCFGFTPENRDARWSWGSQQHGCECSISPADSRARVVGPGGVGVCTALSDLSLGREPNNSVALHVGPGLLASPPPRHVFASVLLFFGRPDNPLAVPRMSTSVWCARCRASDSGRWAGTATSGVLCPSRFESSYSLRNLPHRSSASTRLRPPAWMLCFGPADPLAAHLHVLSSTALCHRVLGFVPGFVPPRTALCSGLCTAVQGTSDLLVVRTAGGVRRALAAANSHGHRHTTVLATCRKFLFFWRVTKMHGSSDLNCRGPF